MSGIYDVLIRGSDGTSNGKLFNGITITDTQFAQSGSTANSIGINTGYNGKDKFEYSGVYSNN